MYVDIMNSVIVVYFIVNLVIKVNKLNVSLM